MLTTKMAMSKHLQLKLLLDHWEESNVKDMFLSLVLKKKIMLNKRKHRFWVHNIIQERKKYGAFYHFVQHLELDGDKYSEYFRMSPQDMETVLGYPNVNEEFSEEELEVIHDLEMTPSRRPKVLVQTAGQVSGGVYYYQQTDLKEDTWPQNKKMYGVSIHPKYGGWFVFRPVVIFKNIECPDLEQQLPEDCVPTQELRKELLERYNFRWQDMSYRDIIPVVKRYSEEQKLYFDTPSKDRHELLVEMKKKHMGGD